MTVKDTSHTKKAKSKIRKPMNILEVKGKVRQLEAIF